MTTLQITLSDDLASDAAKAGLLTTERLEDMLRDQLRKEAGGRLRKMMDEMQAVSGTPMSMDEINAEVKAVRRERRERLGAASA
jgi:Arc/MetJ family transcription regulator